MDPVSSALGLAAFAAQATATLYKICERRSDAPRGVHELMDELEDPVCFCPLIFLLIYTSALRYLPEWLADLTSDIINLVKDGLKSRDRGDHAETTAKELLHLLRKAELIIAKIQAFVGRLFDESGVDAGLNSRRRL